MTLLEFVPQCCDASIYLKMGKLCAEQGICYNNLRPMGAVYWFSLPYRFGLPPSSLILGHYLLLAISVMLSVIAGKNIRSKNFGIETPPLILGVFAVCSLVVHVFFLFPVLHTSLSDAPASLSALLATWLLLLAPETGKRRMTVLACGGLALGMAAWLRAFFLYPLLVTLGVWLLLQLWRKGWQWRELLILTALAPIAIQYSVTYKINKQFSYLDPKTHQGMYHEHIESLITGYDTILPFDYHTSYSFCERHATLPEALHHFDVYSMYCLFGGRLYFYLGSYSPYPYLPPFEHKLPEIFLPDYQPLSADPNQATATRQNFVMDAATEISFFDENKQPKRAMAYKLWKPDPEQNSILLQTLALERNNIYQLHINLWSDYDLHYINLIIREHDNQKIVASSGALLAPFNPPNAPNNAFLNTRIEKNALYDIVIRSEAPADDSPMKKAAAEIGRSINTGVVYVWEASLAKIILAEPTTRTWSVWLLLVNSAVSLAALLFIKSVIAKKEPLEIIVVLLPLLSLGASLCILPEQRFAIYPLIMLWWFTLVGISSKNFSRRNAV